MEFSSKLLENAVYEMSQLPGIGKRTALRLVLHLLKQSERQTEQLSNALTLLRSTVRFCSNCHNISDVELCEICANPKSDESSLVCVVEDIRDVMAIENTGQFKGKVPCFGRENFPYGRCWATGFDDYVLSYQSQEGRNKRTHICVKFYNGRGYH